MHCWVMIFLDRIRCKRRTVGHTLGFPTANISIAENYKLIPAEGIYAVMVGIEDRLHEGSYTSEASCIQWK